MWRAYAAWAAIAVLLAAQSSVAFVSPTQVATWRTSTEVARLPRTAMANRRFDREFEESSQQRGATEGGGAAETAAGLILGGLVMGPFGKRQVQCNE